MSCADGSLPVFVSEPLVPFVRATRLTLGRLYTVRGCGTQDARRFCVNFLVGGSNGDVALHVDTRFDQKAVVRNSRIADCWQTEERDGSFPLSPGQKFTMMILVENARFMIAYNDKHFTEFVHRLPPFLIDSVEISGAVRVSMFLETQSFSSLPPPLPRPLSESPLSEDKAVVFVLPSQLTSTQRILVSGVPKKDSFSLNLVTRADRTGDTALHISCRYGWFPYVVLNSHVCGSWGSEIRPSNLKLRSGHQFVFEISAMHNEYRVVLDGCYTAAFPERHIKASAVTALSIMGDVKISFVSF